MSMKQKMAKAIVKKVQTLYKKQIKSSANEGYHHPTLHSSTPEIQKLMKDFEDITGMNWDKDAEKYL